MCELCRPRRLSRPRGVVGPKRVALKGIFPDPSVLSGPGPRSRPPVSSERRLVGPARFRDAFRGHGPGITKAVTAREHESWQGLGWAQR